jgi:hypothetical protein
MKTAVNKKVAIVLTTFVLLTQPVFGQTVFGMPDCGEWINKANNPQKGWLLGYMSGLNTLHDIEDLKPESPLKKINSANQVFLWMDNYCKTNPLKTVGDGGWVLFKELRKK